MAEIKINGQAYSENTLCNMVYNQGYTTANQISEYLDGYSFSSFKELSEFLESIKDIHITIIDMPITIETILGCLEEILVYQRTYRLLSVEFHQLHTIFTYLIPNESISNLTPQFREIGDDGNISTRISYYPETGICQVLHNITLRC